MGILMFLNATNILFNYRECLLVIHPVTVLIALLQFLELSAHHGIRELTIIVRNEFPSNLIIVIFVIPSVTLNEIVA